MHQTVRRIVFSVFFVSIVVAKVVRLYLNAHSFSPVTFVVCLPALLVPDALALFAVWCMLQQRRGRLSVLSVIAACFITCATFAGAVALLSFFWESGGEIQWSDAAAFALDEGARKVAMSGSSNAMVASCGILVTSLVIKGIAHSLVEAGVNSARLQLDLVRQYALSKSCSKRLTEQAYNLLPTMEEQQRGDSNSAMKWEPDSEAHASSPPRLTVRHIVYWAVVATSLLFLLGCAWQFEPGPPYGHVLATLPLSLLSIFNMGDMLKVEDCQDSTWPLPDLVSQTNWEFPAGDFKGWAPGIDNRFIRKYQEATSDWLPDSPPSGFQRWEFRTHQNATTDNASATKTSTVPKATGAADKCKQSSSEWDRFYNPVSDPIKITNLDGDVLPELRSALKLDSVNIKHIVLIQMESMRQDLFPLQYGSAFYNSVLESHKDKSAKETINEELARLTVNTQKITGKQGGFLASDKSPINPASSEWQDETEDGFGGLNIVGTHTTATSSIKSLGAIHCGLYPMPVDGCKESELQSYQPCLPRVLQLFNKQKDSSKSDDYREYPWNPAFFMSIADEFDNQDDMDKMIGFEYVVTRKQVDRDIASGKSKESEINYFGFAETAIKSYIKDYMTNATANNQRMFLSHFTSTMHHPWGTPDYFNTTEYFGEGKGGLTSSHEDMDKYLNTIRWNDAWVGQLMQMLNELKIANETLVVFVGDHGQAFREDAKISGTYQNGHISNFRVPVVFRHPQIPRVQLDINSTSINIIPTILDLLVSTESLNAKDTLAASDLMQEYEGQSLIRPFKTSHKGRRSWNFAVVNPGSRFLAVTSADVPWRLVLSWDASAEYVFTNLATDARELEPVTNWSLKGLIAAVEKKFGADAAQWIREADAVAHWWGPERRRLWEYHEK